MRRNRDAFLPSLTTVIIFIMGFFLSCAHQNRVRDGLEAEAEQTDQVGSAEESAGVGDTAENTTTQETTPPAEGEHKEELAQVDGTAETKPAEGDLTTLSTDQTASTTGDALPPVDGGTETGNGVTAAATPAEDTLKLEDATTPEPQASQNIAEVKITDDPPSPTPVISTPEHTASAWSGNSKVPKIPVNFVRRSGDVLNRFYFVRRGDTPKSVAQLIYGDASKAKKLTKWNGKGWLPGKIVYYASAIDTEDKKMHSFYQEKGLTPEEYAIERGDWLSRVSKKKLGSALSWKEIAVVNGLDSPDSIEVGQKLAIYPKDLAGAVAGVSTEPQPEDKPVQQPIAEAPQQPMQVQPQAQATPEPPPQEAVPAQPVAEEPVKKAPPVKKENMDFSKYLDQNMLAVVILGGAVLLLLALASRRKKRRSAMNEEFADEFSQNSPPTKLKRK